MIEPSENEITGKWIMIGGVLSEDENCSRIHKLINNCLNKIAESSDGWEVLYIQNDMKRYWELSYPEAHLEGGGPPKLVNISYDDANIKYEIV